LVAESDDAMEVEQILEGKGKKTNGHIRKTKQQDTVATLRPQLEKENQLRLNLTFENQMLAQQVQLHTDLSNLRDAQIMELERERQRLEELLNMQLQRRGN
ncbi:hypothetical protein Tco_0593704, partial [Tanacetum coccineum]